MKGFWGRMIGFGTDVKGELKKISYPTRTETIGSTTVVMVLVLLIGVYLFGVDLILSKLIQNIIH